MLVKSPRLFFLIPYYNIKDIYQLYQAIELDHSKLLYQIVGHQEKQAGNDYKLIEIFAFHFNTLNSCLEFEKSFSINSLLEKVSLFL